MTASICHECCGLGQEVEEKKREKGKEGNEKGRGQQKKHAAFQFPKSLMPASTGYECCGLGARRMQNGNQTKKGGKGKTRRREEEEPCRRPKRGGRAREQKK